MSINGIIVGLIKSGRLIEYEPEYTYPDFRKVRRVFVSEEAYSQCPPTGPTNKKGFRGAALRNARQALKDFIGGAQLVKPYDLKRLDAGSDEVWEIRVIEKPHVRLLGWFPVPDTFVITHCELRDDLGWSRNDPRWEKTVHKCVEKRTRLFPDLPVFHGSRFAEYITTNGVDDDE